MVALITDPRLEEELIEQRRTAGVDRFDEVWDGLYVIAPPADNEHQGLVSELTTVLTIAVDWPGRGNVFPGVNVTDQQEDWRQNYRCPDVAVFLNDTQAEDRRSHWFGGPDLASEVVHLNWRIRSVDGRASIEVLHHDSKQRWVIMDTSD